MSLSTMIPSIQDFSLIKSFVEKYKKDYSFNDYSNAFYFFVLNIVMGLQDDEIRDSITDNYFLKVTGGSSGHDRGIDAVYIDDTETIASIHFFNFKYTDKFDKLEDNFPSGEIDKITGFFTLLMQKDQNLKTEINPVLFSKVQEIWKIFDNQNPKFFIHICSNHYQGFEKNEKNRFEREIHRHSNFTIQYHLMPDLVNLATSKGQIQVDGKIKAIDKNFFEKSDGDIRALILNVEARDLIRIVLNDEDIRQKTDLINYDELKNHEILEDAFENNVRVYLKQRSKINKNIKKTALSDDSHRFFYFNNGITITCDAFRYPKTQRAPIVELENIQVVNGSQTIHALYEAFIEDSSKFEYTDILCRIYETKDSELSTNIAEYTNSQNPVKSRDIRSIDYIQQKLEQELLVKGLYYERKKNQHAGRKKDLRLDAEKIGQVLMAFYKGMPSEAKNSKSLIFGEKYELIFDDEVTADKVLLPYVLFNKLEDEKEKAKEKIIKSSDSFEKESYIIYSSYYYLYVFNQLQHLLDIPFQHNKLEEVWKLYPIADKIIKELIKIEQAFLKKNKVDSYTHNAFFKSNKPKKHFEDLRDKSGLDKFLTEGKTIAKCP